MTKNIFKNLLTPLLCTLGLISISAQATIVEFQTSHGNFKVNLHDETTPKTVENFLNYVNSGSYNDTIIHRTVDNFIIQGGGAKFEGTLPPSWIDVEDSIINEPVYSNVKATIAMAKQGGVVNSATSQWFINLENNSTSGAQLDTQNGGFTVFGEVIEDGMDVVNLIAAVERCNTGYSGFQELPMPDYAEQCSDSSAVPSVENFVTIYQVVIFDSTVKTDSDLSSVRNTSLNNDTDAPTGSEKSGGGTLIWYTLVFLGLLISFRQKS
ncbi:peptidylprolyl isomerase [Colwellia sp. 1_MG-2023]|uniref:peptidylprolyl isomerase n=1 Tax=Colwellia sp. 1_MG-2023 TaxID=3062649 RepID=UPI0026E34D4E|nr:peptidylprolyl isomerase [Colwellia sp. 1_MG-2023]MDO6445815.1 peptidylprolyl isomerase [Colwellia sp. 1_MG-2023]